MQLTLDIVFMLAVLLSGLSAIVWVLFFSAVTENVEEDDRAFMDPLPPMLKLLWPMVQLLANTVVQFFSNAYLDRLENRLQKTGVGYLLGAEQFVALRMVAALITFGLGLLIIAALNPKQALLILLVAPLAGYMFPLVWLADTRKRREIQVIRTLPVYLDFITMAVEAGLNLPGALQQAMQKGPKGPLQNEFGIVMRDLRSGLSRADALKRMADRLDIDDITSFVNAMIQSERMGSSMAKTLRLQSDQRRTERFQRAEKQAMQAPVKLIFPLIVFIFPVTFIILGFPIVMKFLNQ
ncbi:MAG: type II secretion system F family protein [Chromatiales bacterium]|jgi:tight adherence protein C